MVRSTLFDRYPAPDFVVTDAAAAVQVLESKLGLPGDQPVRPTLFGSGFDIANLVVNTDELLGASRIQVMGVRPLGAGEPENETGRVLRAMLLAYISAQRWDRPIVSHVNCLAAPTLDDLLELADLLKSRDVPHVALIDNIYLGMVDDGNRLHYDASVDGGLMLEFAPTFSPRYPGFIPPPELPVDGAEASVPPGTFVRATARTHLVENLDAILDRLRAMLDWPDEDCIARREGDGFRSCMLLPRNGLSAVWELVEPTRADSRAGRDLARYGPGAWSVRIGVFGLDEKLEDLSRRGTRWLPIEGGPLGNRVAVNRWDLRGMSIELEELPVVYRGERPAA